MESMGFMEGFIRGMAMTHDQEKKKTFDWDKAAKYIVENNVKNASAGLNGDWDCTSGDILVDGKIETDTYVYLASTWATPTLLADGEEIPCYLDRKGAEERGWDSKTLWPESALNILKEAGFTVKE